MEGEQGRVGGGRVEERVGVWGGDPVISVRTGPSALLPCASVWGDLGPVLTSRGSISSTVEQGGRSTFSAGLFLSPVLDT